MLKQNEIICYCKNISKKEIEDTIAQGSKTLKDIQERTTACTGVQCKELNPKSICCSEDIIKLLPKQDKSCNCCCDH